jgi:hypothetical protein
MKLKELCQLAELITLPGSPKTALKIRRNHLAETACTCLNRLLDDREPHNSLFQVAATHGTGHRSEGPIKYENRDPSLRLSTRTCRDPSLKFVKYGTEEAHNACPTQSIGTVHRTVPRAILRMVFGTNDTLIGR